MLHNNSQPNRMSKVVLSLSLFMIMCTVSCLLDYDPSEKSQAMQQHDGLYYRVLSKPQLSIAVELSSSTIHSQPPKMKAAVTLKDAHIPIYFHRQSAVNWRHHQITKVDDSLMHMFENTITVQEKRVLDAGDNTDGEELDALEHFFWGLVQGVSIELGSLDGWYTTHSQTASFERIGWKRILIEGNPTFSSNRTLHCPEALGIKAVVCANVNSSMHYINRPYIGGIVEFMTPAFIKSFHPEILNAGIRDGEFDVASIDWSQLTHQFVAPVTLTTVQCLPLHIVFENLRLSRVNFFILDVEGAEIEVLKTIDWAKVTFDVLCVETEAVGDSKNRPEGFGKKVKEFLEPLGYLHYGDAGRNSWFIHNTFVPSARPRSAEVGPLFRGYNLSRSFLSRPRNSRKRKLFSSWFFWALPCFILLASVSFFFLFALRYRKKIADRSEIDQMKA